MALLPRRVRRAREGRVRSFLGRKAKKKNEMDPSPIQTATERGRTTYECGRRRRERASVCTATGEWDRARVCVNIFDEHPFTSPPMGGRYDRGTEGRLAFEMTFEL